MLIVIILILISRRLWEVLNIEAEPDDFNSAEEYQLDFLEWVNSRKENREYLFNASMDLTTDKLFVASTFVTRLIDLRIVLK